MRDNLAHRSPDIRARRRAQAPAPTGGDGAERQRATPRIYPRARAAVSKPERNKRHATEELEAAFIAALNEAGVKASPEEARLAAHVFAREIEAGSV